MKNGGKELIVQILMKRDEISREEAEEMFEDTKEEIMEAISGTSFMDPEEVLESELGLEPDYLMDFIY